MRNAMTAISHSANITANTPSTGPLRLIHPRGYDYFAILRDKLRWGRGPQTPSERA